MLKDVFTAFKMVKCEIKEIPNFKIFNVKKDHLTLLKNGLLGH